MLRQPFRRGFHLGVLALFIGACDGPPVPPTGVLPAPWAVTGTVWLHQSSGVAAAQSGVVFAYVERPDRGSSFGPVPIGPNGRYDFMAPWDTIRVRLQRSEQSGYQPCAVTLESAAALPADLHLVADTSLLGGNLPAELSAKAPTLSGVVYENTPAGRRGVPNAWVVLDGLNGSGLVIADTSTDADGRYVLCGVPFLPGLMLQALAPGFELAEISKGLIANATVDIELKRR